MSGIQSFFVRAKHWQVFTIIVGLFCCAEALFASSILSAGEKIRIPVPALIGTLVFYCFVAMWYWSMGSFINSVLNRTNLRFFGFAIVYPLAYLLLFNLFFDRLTPVVIIAVFPLHLLAMFCLFYGPGFITRNLVAAETGKVVSFRDYVGPLLLLWFFPVGIWFIQPRINRLYAGTFSLETA